MPGSARTPIPVRRQACSTCPYRRDTPTGVWAVEEYEKLPGYDDGSPVPAIGVFLCHHSDLEADRSVVCRGWAVVAGDSIAARLAVASGVLDAGALREAATSPGEAFYASGAEAAAAGVSGVERPSREAAAVIGRMMARRARKEATTMDDKAKAQLLARVLHDDHGWSYARLGALLGWGPEWTRRWVLAGPKAEEALDARY